MQKTQVNVISVQYISDQCMHHLLSGTPADCMKKCRFLWMFFFLKLIFYAPLADSFPDIATFYFSLLPNSNAFTSFVAKAPGSSVNLRLTVLHTQKQAELKPKKMKKDRLLSLLSNLIGIMNYLLSSIKWQTN